MNRKTIKQLRQLGLGLVLGFLGTFPLAFVLAMVNNAWGKNASLATLALLMFLAAPGACSLIRRLTGQGGHGDRQNGSSSGRMDLREQR